ncbi:MAG: hypothetical protein V2A58_05890, partial [Planctomycetota bacterium]
MNARERFRNAFTNAPVDRPYLPPEGAWAAALARWRTEGMTDESDLAFDGSETCAVKDFLPPFAERVVADEGDKLVMWAANGQLIRTWKTPREHDPGVQYLRFPVTDRASWLTARERLDPDHPDHLGPDWPARAKRLRESDTPVRFDAGHSLSVFGFARDLVGDPLYTWFYDEPGLIREIMDFLADRFARLLDRVAPDVP